MATPRATLSEVPALIAGNVPLMNLSEALARAGLTARHDADRGMLVIEPAEGLAAPQPAKVAKLIPARRRARDGVVQRSDEGRARTVAPGRRQRSAGGCLAGVSDGSSNRAYAVECTERGSSRRPRQSLGGVRYVVVIAAISALSGCATSAPQSAPADPTAACVRYAEELINGAVLDLEARRHPLASTIEVDRSIVLYGLRSKGCIPPQHYVDLAFAQLPKPHH
jgi:hypothetical protein